MESSTEEKAHEIPGEATLSISNIGGIDETEVSFQKE